MNIVQPSPGDIGLREAAALVGRSTKTLRRAAHLGELPLRYVPGPRGLGLVFARDEVERWQTGRPRYRHRRAAPATADGSLAAMPEILGGLRESLGAARAAISRLDGHPGRVGALVLESIAALERRLAAMERSLNAPARQGRIPE